MDEKTLVITMPDGMEYRFLFPPYDRIVIGFSIEGKNVERTEIKRLIVEFPGDKDTLWILKGDQFISKELRVNGLSEG